MADLIEQYKQLHADPNLTFGVGLTVRLHGADIGAQCRAHSAKSLLDYGAGKGWAYNKHYRVHKDWPVHHIYLYDPAVPQFSKLPNEKFDAVISIDVAEHLPEEELDEFVKTLYRYARKFVYITVATRPSTKFLLDGRNSHLTLWPEDRWRDFIAERSGGLSTYLRFTK